MVQQLSLPVLPHTPVSWWRKPWAPHARALSASALDAYVAQGYLNIEALERVSLRPHARTQQLHGVARQQTDLIAVERRRLAGLAGLATQLLQAPAAEGGMPLTVPRLTSHSAALLTVAALGMTALGMPTSLPAPPQLQGRALAVLPVAPLGAAPALMTVLAAPGPRTSVLEHERVVAVYGHPGAPVTGILGKHPPEGAALEALRLARLHEAASGLPTRGALHVTAGLAHPFPGGDGTYLEYLDPSTIDQYVAAARRHGLLLILDTQIGWGDPLEQARHFARYLSEPFVHLALDPEFATRSSGLVPGSAIGTLDATRINAVQHYLADLVRPTTMPAKMLIVHQFRADMLGRAERIEAVPDVDLVIDMDGFGTPEDKLESYERFSLSAHADRPAIKLFFEWDVPLMLPARIEALPVPPRLVIYQ